MTSNFFGVAGTQGFQGVQGTQGTQGATGSQGAQGSVITADTGWTANADAGDKTKVIPVAATIAAFSTALDAVSAGLGSAFVATAEKCKSLETALVAFKVPNA